MIKSNGLREVAASIFQRLSVGTMASFVLSIQPSFKPGLTTLLLKLFGISAIVGAYLLITAQPVFRSELGVLRTSNPESEDETGNKVPVRIVTLSPPSLDQVPKATQKSEVSQPTPLRTEAATVSQDSQPSSRPPSLPQALTSPQPLTLPQTGSSPQARSLPQARSSPPTGSAPKASSSPQGSSSSQARSSPQAPAHKRQSIQPVKTRSHPNRAAVASKPQPSPPTLDFSDLLTPSSAAPVAVQSLPLPQEASLPSPSQSSPTVPVAIAPPSRLLEQRPLPLPEEEPSVPPVPVPSPPESVPPQSAFKPQPQPLPPETQSALPVAKPIPEVQRDRISPPPKEPTGLSTPPVISTPTSPSKQPAESSTPPVVSTPAPVTGSVPKTVPQAVPENIFVERFDVVGSTIFNPETLALIAAQALTPTKPSQPLPSGLELDPHVINRLLSPGDLLQASEAITKYYTDRGYINSGAFIPQDALHDGIATIRIIEGSLEDINITRNPNRSNSLLANPFYSKSDWLDPNPIPDRLFLTGNRPLNLDYIRSRLELGGRTPLNLNRLLEAVQLLQLDPLIETISTEISKGTRTGTSILNVKFTQADTSDIQFSVDNGRSPSVGSIRERAQVSQGNFLGLGDRLILGYSHTSGSDGWDGSYTLPINRRNGTLSFSAGRTTSSVIEKPFNFLDIQSASRYYELTLRQPVILTPTEELALSLTASRRESESEFLKALTGSAEPFPGVGADAEGRTRISALRFAQEWTKQGEDYVLALQSEFSFGLNAFNSTINPIPPDSRFFSWRGRGQWVRRLGPDTLFLLRGEIQLADRPLVPLEQFGLGGQSTIRGYRQDTLLTDNGWLASAELRVPILRIPEIGGILQLAPFVEMGKGWNLGGIANPDPNTLASTGLGLLWRQGNFSARFDWGIPLTSVSSSGDSLQERGLYFSINYSPF
ncbi:MAG TPA: ShlB/FhaC/HecB family hemolysin secretion/activation protein [Allocoleopsis sp.]